jgi:hypothetical protein
MFEISEHMLIILQTHFDLDAAWWWGNHSEENKLVKRIESGLNHSIFKAGGKPKSSGKETFSTTKQR